MAIYVTHLAPYDDNFYQFYLAVAFLLLIHYLIVWLWLATFIMTLVSGHTRRITW